MPEGSTVEIKGKTLCCPHCGGHAFVQRRAKLNTAFMSLFDLDWLNDSAEVFVCAGCGRLEWFLGSDEIPLGEDIECLDCGAAIPAGQDKCMACGWTFKE